MSGDPRIIIRGRHRFTASPERVFDALLDPAWTDKRGQIEDGWSDILAGLANDRRP